MFISANLFQQIMRKFQKAAGCDLKIKGQKADILQNNANYKTIKVN